MKMISFRVFKAIILLCLVNILSAKVPDWLITKIDGKTTLSSDPATKNLLLSNGLITREFTAQPDFATVDFYSHEKESSLLRAIFPEAVISLDGKQYNVGGLVTKTHRAYLNRTELSEYVTLDPNAFHLTGYSTSKPVAPFPYKPMRGAPKDIVWPPKGLRLDVNFTAPSSAPATHKQVTIQVHYEMYDGIPLLVKWLSASIPQGMDNVGVNFAVQSVEYLGVNMGWAGLSSDFNQNTGHRWLYVETDQPHGTTVGWGLDPMSNQMPGSFEPVVNCSYSTPVFVPLGKDGFESFKVHELVIGSSDMERISLARHRMFRLLAPHTQENPIFFHMTSSIPAAVKFVLNQLKEVGFEMMIFSFGSGFQLESESEGYLKAIAELISYAHARGIEVGGYDLISLSRQVKHEWMALKPDLNETVGSACFASGWQDFLLERTLNFINATGLSMLETDGPYGGYSCASTTHSHHTGMADSVYRQNKLQGDFYRKMREKEIFINQPDNFFYQGGSKTAMGYNENQYSLPRWQDLSISRQSIYDDTYVRTVTAGWMFVPISEYHAGGSAATFMPLTKNKLEYEWALAQYLGAGVAACYRGPFIYDSEETKQIVIKWVSFYKKYRDILTSDIVHIRRPDMQSIDSFMHVNPFIKNKGLAMVFNPTFKHIVKNLTLPLYYTGLTDKALVSEQDKPGKYYTLDRGYGIDVLVDLLPRTITWFLIQ